jgi:hypothetical protein
MPSSGGRHPLPNNGRHTQLPEQVRGDGVGEVRGKPKLAVAGDWLDLKIAHFEGLGAKALNPRDPRLKARA